MSTLANAAREAAAILTPAAVASAAAAETSAAAEAPAATATTPAPVAAAPVVAAQAPAVDATAIRAEARTAERARIQAIVGHAEADGRTALAHQLAFGTDLAPDAAAALLATAPKAEGNRSLTGATVPQPAIAPQGGGTDKGDASSRLAAARKALTT